MVMSVSERLKRFYQQFSGDDQVLIVINADPDSIASAMAIKRLLWRKVASITLSNINVVKRPDNLSMIRLLNLKLVYFDEIDVARYTRFVMVDSQPAHHELFQRIHPDVIIDHHPYTGVEASFLDIRPQYGAAASIMAEYLKAAKIKPSIKLASGLCYAIKTDTNNFERQTHIEDVKAFQFFFKHASVALIRKIEHSELKVEFLKYFRRALQTMYMVKGKVFVHLGTVSTPDVCVLVADFYMKVDTVNTTVVSGFYDDKLVIVLRNDGLRKHAGEAAKRGFGQIGSAGGHKTRARAEIRFSELVKCVDHKNDKKLLRWIRQRVSRNYRPKKEINS